MFDSYRITITDELKERLLPFLDEQIGQALQARSELEERWQHWNEQYETARNTLRNQPWDGACDIGIPLTATHCEAIFARIMNTILALDPPFIAKPLRSDFVLAARRYQDYMVWAAEHRWKFLECLWPTVLNMVKLGTAIIKIPYIRETDLVCQYNEDYTAMEMVEEEISSGPQFVHVPLQDFLIPVGAKDIEDSPWVAQRSHYTMNDLIKLEAAGHLDDVKRLEGLGSQNVPEFEARRNEMESILPSYSEDRYSPWEWWGEYDADDDGYPEKVVITYHMESRTVLSATHHPYFHRRRPFVRFVYMPREDRFYAIGIPEMLEDPQDGITTMHRQRIDNKSIANMQCFTALQSSGIRPKTKIYPGKVFLVNDHNDIKSFPLGQIFNSTIEDENMLKQYAERRTGISDYSLGRESDAVGTKATATATLALIQEGNKRFDLTIRDFRRNLAECAVQALQLNQQFKPLGEIFTVLGPAGMPVEQIINFPQEYIRSRISIQVNTSSAGANREVSKQNDLALFGILAQYQMRTLQMVQAYIQAPMPEVKAMLSAMLEAQHRLFSRNLENYDIKDVTEINPNVMEILNGQARQGTLAGDVRSTGMESVYGLPGGTNPNNERTILQGQGPSGIGPMPGPGANGTVLTGIEGPIQ